MSQPSVFKSNKTQAVRLPKAVALPDMAVSDVTLCELYYGAERYDDPAPRIAIIEGFAARLGVLPFDTRAALQAGHISATLERQGRTIGADDLMIAAIAR